MEGHASGSEAGSQHVTAEEGLSLRPNALAHVRRGVREHQDGTPPRCDHGQLLPLPQLPRPPLVANSEAKGGIGKRAGERACGYGSG